MRAGPESISHRKRPAAEKAAVLFRYCLAFMKLPAVAFPNCAEREEIELVG
jgi:hypothetical protein